MVTSHSPGASISLRSPASSHTLNIGIPESVLDASSSNNGDINPVMNGPPRVSPAVNQGLNSEGGLARQRGRKAHTKSRTGCFNCKKARIKCLENRPSCDYCSHRGLQCVWPDLQINQVSQTGALIRKPTRVVPTGIVLKGPVFTMLDFRLFNHFIQTAYPHYPPRDDSVWTHEIPSLASDYDYLLHSMLALSASDIAETEPSSPELKCTAIAYRVKAIGSLNQAIGQGLESIEQGNAMIATCFSLLFQSTFLSDGLVEYMTFIRGVLAVSVQMGKNNLKFLFQHMFDQVQVVESELTEAPLIPPDQAHGACRSLQQLCPLVQNTREVEFYEHLLSASRALLTSSRDAYSNLAKIYNLFSYVMSHEEFAAFISPFNEAGKLLQSHFVALQLVMTPFTRRESTAKQHPAAPGEVPGSTGQWLVAIHRDIKPEMMKYYEWPRLVHRELEAGRLWNEDTKVE